MFPPLGVPGQRQTATKRMVFCWRCVGVSFLAIAGLGLLPRLQAAALASQVNVHPPTITLPEPAAGQGGLVTLRGNTRPEAKAINDRGRVSDDLTLDHMMLQLQRTP